MIVKEAPMLHQNQAKAIGANTLEIKSGTLLPSYNRMHDCTHLIANYLIKRTAHAAFSVTLTK